MKCQKCGSNEVNFHYSTNVNGCVTETHLCSNCAAECGYDINKFFNREQSFDIGSLLSGIFPVREGFNGFMPPAIPVIRSTAFIPIAVQSNNAVRGATDMCNCGCETGTVRRPNTEVDEEMKQRRELNAQMRAAVEKEEFEKAAELRDKIKALETSAAHRAVNAQENVCTQGAHETGGSVKCDSETTSQDSPAAQ